MNIFYKNTQVNTVMMTAANQLTLLTNCGNIPKRCKNNAPIFLGGILVMKKIVSIILCVVLTVSGMVIQAGALEASGAVKLRYTVIALDRSGSMVGEPLEKQIEAAIMFCESILSLNANDKIAVVSFGNNASIDCGFTNDFAQIKETIENIKILPFDPTNSTEAFEFSGQLLDGITDKDAEKNVLFCSDGLPYGGKSQSEGKYTYEDYYDYDYANSAYDAATKLWSTTNVYGLGFFYDLSDDSLVFGKRFIADISNKNSYIVNDIDKLIEAFGDIADDITAVDTPDEPTATPDQSVIVTTSTTTTTTATKNTASAAAVAQAITTGGAPIAFVAVLMVVLGSIAIVAYKSKKREDN